MTAGVPFFSGLLKSSQIIAAAAIATGELDAKMRTV